MYIRSSHNQIMWDTAEFYIRNLILIANNSNIVLVGISSEW